MRYAAMSFALSNVSNDIIIYSHVNFITRLYLHIYALKLTLRGDHDLNHVINAIQSKYQVKDVCQVEGPEFSRVTKCKLIWLRRV